MPRGKPGTFSVCTIEDCEGKTVGQGLCRKHYTRWRIHGDATVVVDQSRGACTIDDCPRPHKAHGYCETHYRRLQRQGDPLVQGRPRRPGGPEERFWAQVTRDGPVPEHRPELGPCWQWIGGTVNHGYGSLAVDGRTVNAYAWAYRHFVGPVPPGRELDHLCRNRACVRTDHLEPVTHAENVRRGERPSRTSCPAGHLYDDGHAVITSQGARLCRTCHNAKRRATWAAGRAPRASRTHCRNGHLLEDGNVYVTGTGMRLCKTCKLDSTRRSYAANVARRRARMTLD